MKHSARILISIVLALLLTAATPALALQDTEPPAWEQWGFDSLQEFMDAMGLQTEKEYYDYIADFVEDWEWQQELDRNWEQWKEDFLAQNPDYLEKLKAETPLWQYLGYDSLEDFMYWYGFETVEEYEKYMLDWYLEELYADEMWAQRALEERVAMGGPAEGVGVMLNGVFVRFPDAQPEITDGRTMVPIRAFMEMVGARVEYTQNAQLVTLALEDGRELCFQAGSTEITVTEPGQEQRTVEMDTAPYIKNDRTYVPVRFFSEALGYDVFWDLSYHTAVILDKAALVAEVDANFTILNGVLAAEMPDEDLTLRKKAAVTLDVIQFDSLFGDKTAKLTGGYTALTRGQNVDMKGELDFSGLLALLVTLSESYYLDTGDLTDLAAIAKSEFELIYNDETGMMYVKSPLLSYLNDEAPNAWFSMPVTAEELGSLLGDQMQGMTVGSLLYDTSFGYNSYADIYSVQEFRAQVQSFAQVMGDAGFTEKGDGWELNYNMDAIGRFYEQLTGSHSEGLREGGLTLRLGKDGSYSGSFLLTLEDYFASFRLAADMTVTKTAQNMALSLHVKNSFQAEMKLSAETSAGSGTLRTEPPAGAAVIDFYGDMTGDANLDYEDEYAATAGYLLLVMGLAA